MAHESAPSPFRVEDALEDALGTGLIIVMRVRNVSRAVLLKRKNAGGSGMLREKPG